MNDALFQKLGEVKTEWDSPANLITAMRLFVSPIIALLLAVGSYKSAAVFIGLAWLSDVIDGRVAVLTGTAEGKVGVWLDPLADKLLHATTFIFVWLPLIGPRLVAGAIGLMLGQFISYIYLARRYPKMSGLFVQHSTVFGKAETAVAGTATMAILAARVFGAAIPPVAPYVAMGLIIALAAAAVWRYWRDIPWHLLNGGSAA